MTSTAKTPEEYLESLPADRREAISTVRDAILKALPAGYEETMQYGMISYVIPHSLCPEGYHCDPRQAVTFLCLASQKNYMSIYMMGLYMSPRRVDFEARYAATGKKLDMGGACLRFKKLENLALDVVIEEIAAMPLEKYLALYRANVPASKKPKTSVSQS